MTSLRFALYPAAREGTEVEIHCLHPRPPVPQETAQSTERDAELIVVGKESKGKQLPIVVMGDSERRGVVAHERSISKDQRAARSAHRARVL